MVLPETMPSNEPLVLIDGSGFIFRAFFALPPMTRSDGTPVNAVLGFVNMLQKVLSEYPTAPMAVIFDASRQNFRHEIYPAYKANRNETPPDLIPQFPLIRDAARAFNLPAIELDGFEADDLIASYVCSAKAAKQSVVIVSSDKDLLQLLGESDCGTATVQLRDPLTYQPIGVEAAIKKFGVLPHLVADVQALAGDSSDNVPGVPGIGVKTAAELITQFGDLENLLANIENIKQSKRRQLLTEFADQARISKRLVILKNDVPLPAGLDTLARQAVEPDKLIAFCTENGFKSVLQRLGLKGDNGSAHNPSPPKLTNFTNKDLTTQSAHLDELKAQLSALPQKYWLVKTADELREYLLQAEATGLLALDVETHGLVGASARLLGIALSVRPGEGIYVPLQLPFAETAADIQAEARDDLFSTALRKSENASVLNADTDVCVEEGLPLAEAIEILSPYLTAPHILKVAHNLKFDWQVMQAHGFPHSIAYDDTMLLSYLISGSGQGHGLKDLATQHFSIVMTKFNDLVATSAAGKKAGKAAHFGEVPHEIACQYAAADGDITLRLHAILRPQLLAQRQVQLYEQFERPLIEVITQMELAGIRIDTQKMQALSDDFTKQIAALETEVFTLANGENFNIGSPKQLGQMLFGTLGIQGGKKNKTGEWSTAAAELEPLAAQGHTIIEKVLNWRQLSKLKNTYADSLPQQIQLKTGRIHTSFSMAATSTGRLSSTDPNLQNIPVRTGEGQAIRACFVAAPGHMLISADYSQIELRLVALMADIPALKHAFANDIDIHTLTASEVLGVPIDQVSKDQRRAAKAINFGIIYGISSWGLARQLGVAPGEAGEYIKRYFARFPELRDYMEMAKAEARDFGYVKTLFGRCCMIPGANDKMPARRAGAERQAINAPIQGTAADIMKRAMIDVHHALNNTPTRILLQVHDELICEAPIDRAEADAKLIQTTMMQVGINLGLAIPLLVDVDVKSYWE